ncbi:MAG: hypothetical protein HWD59_05545 [Coxiellaceae bacterium]|nr:MAG: hypothetical protein HWD59_05545 [Coxiellaceae bacterium]
MYYENPQCKQKIQIIIRRPHRFRQYQSKMQQLGSQNEFSNKLKVAAIFKVMSLYNSTYLQIFITPSDIKSCTLDEILRILIKHRASKEVFDSLFNLNIKIRDIKGAWDLINQPDFPLKETLTTDPKWTAEILASMFTNYSYRVDLNLTAEALKIAVKSQNPRLVLFFAKPLNLGLHKRYIQLFNEAMKSNTKSEIDMIKNIINRNYAFKNNYHRLFSSAKRQPYTKCPIMLLAF